MSSIKLFIYGLLCEQSAILAIFGHQPLWQRISLFLSGHLIASTLFALLLTTTFPKRYITVRWPLLCLFFSFNFFIPCFGAVGTLLTMLYFRKYVKDGERTEFFNVPMPPFMAESAGIAPGMGEGGAWTRLMTVGLPRAQRLKALLAVGSGSGNNSSKFLQQATSDGDDEIRLLAFNLCEQHEQKIQKSISEALEKLKAASSSSEIAFISRNLAFAYWEMVYSALVQNELRDFFVGQSAKYAQQAREMGENDPSIATLMARIYLQQRNYEQAEAAIEEALELGADLTRVIPYKAELAFQRRDFVTIKQLLAQDDSLRFKPGIGPVAQFWCMR